MIVSFAIARGLRFASMIELSRPCFCHELYQRVILHTVSSRNRRSWPCAHRRMPPLAGLTALRRAEGPPTFWHPGNGSWGQRFLGSDRVSTVPGVRPSFKLTSVPGVRPRGPPMVTIPSREREGPRSPPLTRPATTRSSISVSTGPGPPPSIVSRARAGMSRSWSYRRASLPNRRVA